MNLEALRDYSFGFRVPKSQLTAGRLPEFGLLTFCS